MSRTDELLERGTSELSQGDFEAALVTLALALEGLHSESDADQWFLIQAKLGETYFRLNRPHSAEEHLREAANGNNVQSLVLLAVIAEQDGDIDLATARRALAASRGDAESIAWIEARS